MREPATACYVTCAGGLADLLARELSALGLSGVRVAGTGVQMPATLDNAYRTLLWSRVANRVLWPVASGAAADAEALYALVRTVDWSRHMTVDDTLAVDAFVSRSAIDHSNFAALRVKDAVVDQFRDRYGRRPSVDRDRPALRINAYLHRDRLRLAIDLSGESLHRRGYRGATGAAPLKENLAAALLLALDWPARAARGEAFTDPLCGSGTLPIEAALIAGRRAVGLLRPRHGFEAWLGHDPTRWSTLRAAAEQAARPVDVPITGQDRDAALIVAARESAARAGVADAIRFERAPLEQTIGSALPRSHRPGLVLANPPYGERLSADPAFYAVLGRALSVHGGSTAALLVARSAPWSRLKLPLKPSRELRNGPIDCLLLEGRLPQARRGPATRATVPDRVDPRPRDALASEESTDPLVVESAHVTPDTEAFANRLRKNLKALGKWRAAEDVRAFRAYDADLPEFALAIDVYDSDARHVVVQEYAAPASVNRLTAASRARAAVATTRDVLDVPPERCHWRVRERGQGGSQYAPDRLRDGAPARPPRVAPPSTIVTERGVRFAVGFDDRLDTGLFLDHRPLRRYLQREARDRSLLNLFSYTGSLSAAAAVGGATRSVSVDLSRRYCEWARHNLALNHADVSNHQVIRADVRGWLAAAEKERFDIVVLDPPTFSNSASLDEDWQVQRDHSATIRAALDWLAMDGLLVFSTNLRRFRLDPDLSIEHGGPCRVEDRTRWSIDRDFRRSPRIHQCWFIRHGDSV